MTVLVAGMGNMFLRDDGFGPEVARRLASDERLPPGVEVVDYGIRGMHLAYDLLAGVDVLVLVDAVPPDRGTGRAASGPSAPGSVQVLRIRKEDLDSGASLDPHGMDPAAVLGKLRTLGGEVPETYVVGCVPADVTEGIGLSPPVTAALPGAIAAVVNLLSQHTSQKN
jgi:hydrogenase maturation protease